MKRIVLALICLAVLATCFSFAESGSTDDAVVFEQAISRLMRIKSRESVDDAMSMFDGITSNYNEASLFAIYASAILDIYDDDMDTARIKLRALQRNASFVELLSQFNLPDFDTITTYMSARDAEKNGAFEDALDKYSITMSFMDSLNRIIQIESNSYESRYSAAIELYEQGKSYEAAMAFKELGDYSNSREMYKKALESHQHEWQAATCIEPETCFLCGEKIGEPLGHSYSEVTCTEPAKCVRCGDILEEALGHEWVEATCTEPKTCKRCGATVGEALGHDWQPATYAQPKTCARCGIETGEKLHNSVKKWDIVLFGTYEQDYYPDTVDEPIEWIVLDIKDDMVLLLSRYILDRFALVDSGYVGSQWEQSPGHEWLNDSFINSAFDADEQKALLVTEYDDPEGYHIIDSENTVVDSTQSRVFLMSTSDVNNYLTTPGARMCASTAYARNHSVEISLSKTDNHSLKGTGSATVGSYYVNQHQLEDSHTTTDGKEAYSWAIVDCNSNSYKWKCVDYYGQIGPIDDNKYRTSGNIRPAVWIDREYLSTKGNIVSSMDTEAISNGWYVRFGSYEQDNNTENGLEPIEWIVLDKNDNGEYLLLSRYALDCQKYNETTWMNENDRNIDWEGCSLRAWLNAIFLNNAFAPEEQDLIKISTIDNGTEQGAWGVYGGKETQDKVFLLSNNEAWMYFGRNSTLKECLLTPYAYKRGGNSEGLYYRTSDGVYQQTDFYYTKRWWLRSQGISRIEATTVLKDFTRESDDVNTSGVAVRPAIWVYAEAVYN